MHVVTIVVTRSKSCHVRTLHSLLHMNIQFLQNGVQHEICFINDDPFEKSEMILAKLKQSDRLIFIDYSINLDSQSIGYFLKDFEQCNCLIFPCVKEGINWDQFRDKVSRDSEEPIEQMGLDFDTEVGQKISENIYRVTKTEPKCWMMDSKSILKFMKNKKKEPLQKLPAKNSELFDMLAAKGVKMCAFVNAQLTTVYSHECLGNILNAAGVKLN